jgi:hypothetical protein
VIGAKVDGLGPGRIVYGCDRKRVVTRREVSTQRQSTTRVHVVWLVRIGAIVRNNCWTRNVEIHSAEKELGGRQKVDLGRVAKGSTGGREGIHDGVGGGIDQAHGGNVAIGGKLRARNITRRSQQSAAGRG